LSKQVPKIEIHSRRLLEDFTGFRTCRAGLYKSLLSFIIVGHQKLTYVHQMTEMKADED
jgi:hypothetical protein